jgi:hypothetical protein
MAAIGVVNLLIMFLLLRTIQKDIDALVAAADQEHTASQSAMDTVESFWASTSR